MLVSSIAWLDTHVFLVGHTPSSFEPGLPPATTYTIITRAKPPQTSFMFQKLPEPCPPFSQLDRGQPHQFMQRLKGFPPGLADTVVIASTASIDIGLATKSEHPLASDMAADLITNVYTTTTMADDSRRASMPINEDLNDTSPIGIAFDLSSKDKVTRPLPKEEYETSPGPLPALMVLNNEGILAVWWMVYADSIRQGTIYPGLAGIGTGQTSQQVNPQQQSSPFAKSTTQSTPAFGQNPFAKPPASLGSLASNTTGSVFGQAASTQPTAPTFGTTSAPTSAFGSTAALGRTQSPWGTPAANNANPGLTSGNAFGKSSFGTASPMGSNTQGATFGMSGGLGHRASPWGAPPSGSATGFGNIGTANSSDNRASPFGGVSSNTPFGSTAAASNPSNSQSGGFASFATKPSGFMAAGTSPAQSIFAQSTPGGAFKPDNTNKPLWGQPDKNEEGLKSSFGGGAFQLGSTFKSDGTAAHDTAKPSNSNTDSMFGSAFGAALAAGRPPSEPAQSKDADMDDGFDNPDDKGQTGSLPKADDKMNDESNTNIHQTTPPKAGGLFGTQSQSTTTPAEVQKSQPASWSFGKPTLDTTTPKDSPAKLKDDRPGSASPQVKAEPASSDDGLSPLNEAESQPPVGFDEPRIPTPQQSKTPPVKPKANLTPERDVSESPLPPVSTSKASFAPGDSSSSSKSSADEPAEPPLPPDPFPQKSTLNDVESAPPELSTLPGEGDKEDLENEALDDEGSGVDVGQEISSPSDRTQSSKVSPESSFGIPKSPESSIFSKAKAQNVLPKGPPLFGEVGKTSTPFFPPPTKTQESPRSPSPVRQISYLAAESLRPESSRSVSAPGPLKAIANRKATMNKMIVPAKTAAPSITEMRKHEEEAARAARARKAEEEDQNLSDAEDEQIRTELQTDVMASKELDPFLAHQDYVGNIDKPGVPGQIEKLYRDINSMVDTLGLNARSLTAFVKGHTEKFDEEEFALEELEQRKDWNLDNIYDLEGLQDQLAATLEQHALGSSHAMLSECRDFRKKNSLLRHKQLDTRKAIDMRKHAGDAKTVLSAPLSLEQASLQHDIRKKYMHLQKMLASTEEELAVLRAKLASADNGVDGKGGNSQTITKKPTVEAITKTILKMTGMVEKKSGDIDVLESQFRNLRFSSLDRQSSRESSPFAFSIGRSPKSNRSRGDLVNGDSHQDSPLRQSLYSDGTPKLSPDGLPTDEIALYRAKLQRRKEVNKLVRDAFEKNGPRIRPLNS